MNKQWTQVSYNHQKTPNHQKSLKTTDRIPLQLIPETENRFEILTNLSTDLITKQKTSQSKKPVCTQVSEKGISHIRRRADFKSRQVHRKDLPNKIPTLVNGKTLTRVSTKHTCHDIKNNTQTIVDHKITILGDSNA
jgi:hypothetical protein